MMRDMNRGMRDMNCNNGRDMGRDMSVTRSYTRARACKIPYEYIRYF